MFFILSKVLFVLISPVTWIFTCIILSYIYRNKKTGRKLLLISICLFFFFGNQFIANEVMRSWEGRPVELSKYHSNYDAAIILGGITNTNMTPRDRVYFHRGADRVIHPMYLYRKGMIRKFIVSGGTGKLLNPKYAEAPQLAEALEIFGVPSADIIIEDKSRNTHENAVYSHEIISRQFPKYAKILLVTSAFHMKRALACFEKEDMKVDALKTDFYSHPREFSPDILLVPSVEAFRFWNKLIKEWVGIIAYKIAGYI